MSERSSVSETEALRSTFRRGDFKAGFRQAESHPTTDTLLLKGDAHRKLGEFEDARTAYTEALTHSQATHGSRLTETQVHLEKRISKVDVVLGDYADARKRLDRLAAAGDSDARKIMGARIFREEVVDAFVRKDYEKVARLARNVLIQTTYADPELELMLAQSTLFQDKQPTFSSVTSGYAIARRVWGRLPDTEAQRKAEALNIMGFAMELAPQCSEDKIAVKAQTVVPPVAVVPSVYKKALDTDPQNPISHNAYRELMGNRTYERVVEGKTEYRPGTNVIPSPRLLENPQALLSQKEEEVRYMYTLTPETHRLLDALAKQIPAMNPNCRISICIPSYMEEKNIYRTLEQYTKQRDINPDQFEIVVLENHPMYREVQQNGKAAYVPVQRDGTKDEVQRFKRDYPNLNVHRLYHVFPGKGVPMGEIRRVLFDTTIWRDLQRPNDLARKDLILGSNDADFYGTKPRALKHLLDLFDADPNIDLMSGKWDFPPEAFMKFPALHAIHRFKRYFDIVQQRYTGEHPVSSGGASTYFRTSIYAGVGGYAHDVSRGSDSEFGRRIAHFRKYRLQQRMVFTDALRVYTDPRRALGKMVSGLHLADQWRDQKWQEDSSVLGKSWDDPEFSSRKLQVFTKERLEEEIAAYKDIQAKIEGIAQNPESKNAKRDKAVLNEVMKFLGVKYTIQNGRLRITDSTKLEAGLRKYRQDHAA